MKYGARRLCSLPAAAETPRPVACCDPAIRDDALLEVADSRDGLREQETLLKEAHHRVKNKLQVVHSRLGLQQRHLADASVRRALPECVRRVRAPRARDGPGA